MFDVAIKEGGIEIAYNYIIKLNKEQTEYHFYSKKILKLIVVADNSKKWSPILKRLYIKKDGLYDYDYRDIGIKKKVTKKNSKWVYALNKVGRSPCGITISRPAKRNKRNGSKYNGRNSKDSRCRTSVVVKLKSSKYANFKFHEEYIDQGKASLHLRCERYVKEDKRWKSLRLFNMDKTYSTHEEKKVRNELIRWLHKKEDIPSNIFAKIFNLTTVHVNRILQEQRKVEQFCFYNLRDE